MSGPLALVGSGEFLDGMVEVDRYLLDQVGGASARVVVFPTAAGLEDPRHWADLGLSHFRRLGAQVEALMVVDRAGAEDLEMADQARAADFIYFSGGQPSYLCETLRDSPLWQAILSAHRRGAVLAGCSAGAMVLGECFRYRRDRSREAPLEWMQALNLLPGLAIIPHYDRWGSRVVQALESLPAGRHGMPPHLTLLGIDEDTALIGDGQSWQVMGRSGVSVWVGGQEARYGRGESFGLDRQVR